tara:strand:- start:204 stop:602 length:399 start_codon:yes stop_codon:yes gene_type:complete
VLQSILKSLVITSVISAGIAWFLTSFEIYFLKSFVLAVLVQIIGWNVFSYIHSKKVQIRITELEVQALGELAKQSSEATCAYCGTANIIPIRFDEDNAFECNNCDNRNSVYIAVETAQITAPVNATAPPDEQ